MAEMEELLKRVEAAKEADRALDIDLADALLDAASHLRYHAWRGLQPRHTTPTARDFWRSYAGKYTCSLDAALALVEEKLPGCEMMVWRDQESAWAAEICDGKQTFSNTSGKTPALVVIEALLRALLSARKSGGADAE